MESLTVFWEIFINTMEAYLFYYLAKKILILNPAYKKKIIALLSLFVVLLTLKSLFPLPPFLSYTLSFVYFLFITCLCFKGSLGEKIIVCIVDTIFSFLAEFLTYFIFQFFTDISRYLESAPLYFIMTLSYILGKATLFLIFTHCVHSTPILTKKLQFTLIFCTIINFFITNVLLDVFIFLYPLESFTYIRPILLITCLCLFGSYAGIFILIDKLGFSYQQTIALTEEKQQLELTYQQYSLFSETENTLKTWRHDYRTQLQTIQELCRAKNYSSLSEYVTELTEQLPSSAFLVSSGNTIIDAILSAKFLIAMQHGIKPEYSLFLPEKLPFSSLDATAILGNLLDNALEACLKMEDTEKSFISLEMKPLQKMLYIKLANSSNGKYYYQSDGSLKSSKNSPQHGLGLKQINKTVEKLHGTISQLPENNRFTTTILLPICENKL